MGIYNSSPLLPDRFLVSDIRNCWLLRADIHRVFDDRTFVLVPKAGTIVNHFLVQTSVLGKLFHNRQPGQLSVAPEFLFARLAWTVIPLGISFTNSAGRRIIIFNVEHQAYETITLRPQNETITLPPQTFPTMLPQPDIPNEDPSNEELANRSEKLDAVFESLPHEARYNCGYYPGLLEVERMKERYLSQHEGEFHDREKQRQALALITNRQ